MEYIRLTEIEKILNEKAQKRLEEAEEKARLFSIQNSSNDGPLEEGSYEWYQSIGIDPPEGIQPKEVIREINVNFNIFEDYNFKYFQILLPVNSIEKVEQWEEFDNNSVIYTVDGEIIVKEDIDSIEKKLNKNK